MQKHGDKALELSTVMLIEAAKKRGIEVAILDRKENFIRLKKGKKIEYVKEATKTSADTYIAPLLMENKEITKLILKENKLSVPEGIAVQSLAEAIQKCQQFLGIDVVIKPNTTNFGLGIVILKEMQCQKTFQQALEIAFKHDETVLIEKYIHGKEYRFLVIDDLVVGILHRMPANVIGDGVHSITELVNEKNRDPLRGQAYKKPLEMIKLDYPEIEFLNEQKKCINDVPDAGEIVFLRKNSNISTGGDSIDYTDRIGEDYKAIALLAAKAVGAKICGVDMIIKDIDQKATSMNYGIIELNFNPALHIHNYPYQGENRHAEEKVLDLLGF